MSEIEQMQHRIDELETQVARHGACICDTGPNTEGPDEYCPQHGRPYDDMIDHLDRIIVYERDRIANAWVKGYYACLREHGIEPPPAVPTPPIPEEMEPWPFTPPVRHAAEPLLNDSCLCGGSFASPEDLQRHLSTVGGDPGENR